MRWLPQPLISAAGSNLRQTYTVQLAATTRLLLREEQLLGRADERLEPIPGPPRRTLAA
ncbi:urease accessory protein UreD [Streptomyces lydicus]